MHTFSTKTENYKTENLHFIHWENKAWGLIFYHLQGSSILIPDYPNGHPHFILRNWGSAL